MTTDGNRITTSQRRVDAEMMLWAIIYGLARWEWFSDADRTSGELCIAGMRHRLDVNKHGPILTEHARGILRRLTGNVNT